MHKKRGQRLTGKNLNVNGQFFKDVIRIFLMLICLTILQEVGVISILQKNCNPFALFPFINTPSKKIKLRFLYIPLTLFLLQPPFLPTQPPFNQSYFFWKSKVKHTVVDVTCFFQDAKSSLTEHKKCFLDVSYGTKQSNI